MNEFLVPLPPFCLNDTCSVLYSFEYKYSLKVFNEPLPPTPGPSPHPLGEGSPQQGGVVLHDSGSERGRFVCDTCGSECRSAAGLKSHTTAMHQARSADDMTYTLKHTDILAFIQIFLQFVMW